MIRMKLEYDAHNRTFKLVDRDFDSVFEDGNVYEMALTTFLDELYEDERLIPRELGPLAHA